MTIIHFQSIHSHFLDFDDRLLSSVNHIDPVVLKIIQPHLSNHGKRVRPALVYLCAEASGNPDHRKSDKYATVVELIHMASLFHDDVIDEAAIRHKKPTLNQLWGNDLAVLAGDLLYISALNMMRNESLQLRDAVHQTVSAMTEAELIQGLYRYKIPDRKTYFKIAEGKTASLISLSTFLGASTNSNHKNIDGFTNFGLQLGLAFQIIDDLLDWQRSANSGKKHLQDLMGGRVTYPLLSLLEDLTEKENQNLTQLLCDSEATSNISTGNKCLTMMEIHNTFIKTRSYAAELIKKCLTFLNSCDSSEYINDLLTMAQMVTSRDR